jgi:hypothetical protein
VPAPLKGTDPENTEVMVSAHDCAKSQLLSCLQWCLHNAIRCGPDILCTQESLAAVAKACGSSHHLRWYEPPQMNPKSTRDKEG